MTDQYGVTTAALQGHARTLDGYGQRLGQALDAARQVSMPSDAYGKICQFFPVLLDPLQQRGLDALAATADAMGTAAGKMGETAGAYDDVERANAGAFGGGSNH